MSETAAESAGAFKTGKHDDPVTSLALATYMGSLVGDRSLRMWVIEEVIYDLGKKAVIEPLSGKKRRFKDKIVYDKTRRRIQK